MKDSLGDRMKHQYENRTRMFLPRRTYTIIRIDGKAFHTFTRHMKKPFDEHFINSMDETAFSLCEKIEGAKFAYTQSDEISLVLTDFAGAKTEAYFDGNIQKIVSVASSIATAHFNIEYDGANLAYFDARVFTIPDVVEVANYFIWRQQDCTRNSISSVAQSLYSPKELHGKNCDVMQEMIFQKGINWDHYPIHLKRGRVVRKTEMENWVNDREIPIFTENRKFLTDLIPLPGYEL